MTTQSHIVEPGSHINITNGTPAHGSVKVVTASGTEIEATLHPGASVSVRAGNENLQIYLSGFSDITGLSLIQNNQVDV
jgi:hypothetical protein